MADGRRRRSAIVVALSLGVSVVVPLAVTTLGAVGAALFVAAKYSTSDVRTAATEPATGAGIGQSSASREAISATAG